MKLLEQLLIDDATSKQENADLAEFIRRVEMALHNCRQYREQPSAVTFAKLREDYGYFFVQQHPIAKRYLPRLAALGARAGCRSCANTLISALEFHLTAEVPNSSPALPDVPEAEPGDLGERMLALFNLVDRYGDGVLRLDVDDDHPDPILLHAEDFHHPVWVKTLAPTGVWVRDSNHRGHMLPYSAFSPQDLGVLADHIKQYYSIQRRIEELGRQFEASCARMFTDTLKQLGVKPGYALMLLREYVAQPLTVFGLTHTAYIVDGGTQHYYTAASMTLLSVLLDELLETPAHFTILPEDKIPKTFNPNTGLYE